VTVSLGYVFGYTLIQLVAMVIVMIPAYYLGRQSAQLEAEKKRDEEWDRKHDREAAK